MPSVDRAVREMYTPSMRLIYTTNEQSAPYLESLRTTMRSIDRYAIFFDDAMKSWCSDNDCVYCNFVNMQTSGNASIKIGGKDASIKIKIGGHSSRAVSRLDTWLFDDSLLDDSVK